MAMDIIDIELAQSARIERWPGLAGPGWGGPRPESLIAGLVTWPRQIGLFVLFVFIGAV